MLTYKHLLLLESEGKKSEITCCIEIDEKLHKSYKSHRDASVIQELFIQREMKEYITID